MPSLENKVNIIGGGIVGCIQAIELKISGYEVSIYEKKTIGSGSTWAGGGIIFPLLPHDYRAEVNILFKEVNHYYKGLSEIIKKLFDYDIELIRNGMFVDVPDLQKLEEWLESNNYKYIASHRFGMNGILIDDVYQIRPPRLIQGIRKYLKYLGINIFENENIEEKNINNARKFFSNGKEIPGDSFIITAGAWSAQLTKKLEGKIFPVRGQMLQYEKSKLLLENIIYKDGTYVLQRKDGVIVAGSTLENVGFNDELSLDDYETLKNRVEKIIPQLSKIKIQKHWCGFRPGSELNIPIILKDSQQGNIFYNCGHFRYGVSMAPASAKKVISLI